MATSPRPRFEELPAEEPEVPLFLESRTVAETLPETSPEIRANAEAFTARYGNNISEYMGWDEPAADRVQMLTRGRELFEQEQFDGNTGGRWTLQQFSTNPVGEPWMALQERDDAGDVQRAFTGTRAEIEQLISDNQLTVTELPAITEGEYYRQAVGRMGLEPEIRQEEGFSVGV